MINRLMQDQDEQIRETMELLGFSIDVSIMFIVVVGLLCIILVGIILFTPFFTLFVRIIMFYWNNSNIYIKSLVVILLFLIVLIGFNGV